MLSFNIESDQQDASEDARQQTLSLLVAARFMLMLAVAHAQVAMPPPSWQRYWQPTLPSKTGCLRALWQHSALWVGTDLLPSHAASCLALMPVKGI